MTIYAGFLAVLVNLLVAVVATFILRAAHVAEGTDDTREDDYVADRGDARVHDLTDESDVAPIARPDPTADPFSSPIRNPDDHVDLIVTDSLIGAKRVGAAGDKVTRKL